MPLDKIIREGETGNKMYFITEGFVEVVINKENGQFLFFELQQGSYFGEVILCMI